MIDQIHAMLNSDTINTADKMTLTVVSLTINTADTITATVLSLTSVISTQGTQRTPVA